MKKLICFVLLVFMCYLLCGETYTVVSIRGINGHKGLAKLKQGGAISIGQELTDNDYVVLKNGNYIELDNSKFIYDEGYVKDVVTDKRRLTKGKIVKASNIAGPVESTRKGVATAASRASDAKEDFDWDE